MDYSLLLGIHNRAKANPEDIIDDDDDNMFVYSYFYSNIIIILKLFVTLVSGELYLQKTMEDSWLLMKIMNH